MHISPPPGASRFMLDAIENATRAVLLLGASDAEIVAAVRRGHDVTLPSDPHRNTWGEDIRIDR